MKKAFTPRHFDRLLPLLGERVGVRGQQAPTKAFTLAEVLITLAIIGVVAAISIPSVISNAQQQEFKTGLHKAVSVLNSAITMNIALDGESPYDNHDLFRYLQRHMSVMKSTTALHFGSQTRGSDDRQILYYDGFGGNANFAFYTTDGMRFELFGDCKSGATNYYAGNDDIRANNVLHESGELAHMCAALKTGVNPNFKCGSYGLANNPNNLTATPCIMLVDVNGDRKPYPNDISTKYGNWNALNKVKIPAPNTKKVSDLFTIIITEDRAIPYGVVAQKAMYQGNSGSVK